MRSSTAATPFPLNAGIGWSLVIVGFGMAAWLDPWSLGERDPALLQDGMQATVRHGHTAVMRMAFLQLALARLLHHGWFPPATRSLTAWLTGVGVLVYAGGHISLTTWPALAGLVPLGALITAIGFAILTRASFTQGSDWRLKTILITVCLGMFLDMVLGLFAVDPGTYRPAYLGADDGLRMRMLRLAQVAVIALAVIALLYYEVASKARPRGTDAGLWALVFGAAGMPLLLTAAAFTTPLFKYLLGLPAWAVLGGTAMGLWLCARRGLTLAVLGWLLVGISLIVGLFMGMYAFDGPLPPPEYIGAYNDFVRRLLRLGHAYAIGLGLLIIFVAGTQDGLRNRGTIRQAGNVLLVLACCLTLGAIGLVGFDELPASALAIGPALVAVATIVCLAPTLFPKP